MESETHKTDHQLAVCSQTPCPKKNRVSWPITPDPQRENGEALFEIDTPLTCISPVSRASFDSDLGLGSRTPKGGTFDSFAPGPEELNFAPRKHLEKISLCFTEPKPISGISEASESCKRRSSIFRALKFDDCGDFPKDKDGNSDRPSVVMENGKNDKLEEIDSEERLLESMYESLLDAIVMKQAEDHGLQENQLSLLNYPASLRTPTSLPLLQGVLDTCPGAPCKPVVKSRIHENLDSLCRKLEF